MLCNVVSVQLRTSEFKNYSHQRKLDFSTNSTKEIFNAAKQLEGNYTKVSLLD